MIPCCGMPSRHKLVHRVRPAPWPCAASALADIVSLDAVVDYVRSMTRMHRQTVARCYLGSREFASRKKRGLVDVCVAILLGRAVCRGGHSVVWRACCQATASSGHSCVPPHQAAVAGSFWSLSLVSEDLEFLIRGYCPASLFDDWVSLDAGCTIYSVGTCTHISWALCDHFYCSCT